MPNQPMVRVCLRLFKDDYETLREMAAARGDGELNLLIRTIIHSYTTQLKAELRTQLDKVN